jgi:hypothetical protein
VTWLFSLCLQVLMELNVANNGIDEFGCFTLLAGLRENTSVSVLVLCLRLFSLEDTCRVCSSAGVATVR